MVGIGWLLIGWINRMVGIRLLVGSLASWLLYVLNFSSGDSDNSDTDSEEEGGFDSDVEVEKNRTYEDKIYANPIRKTKGIKPHMKEEKAVERCCVILFPNRLSSYIDVYSFLFLPPLFFSSLFFSFLFSSVLILHLLIKLRVTRLKKIPHAGI